MRFGPDLLVARHRPRNRRIRYCANTQIDAAASHVANRGHDVAKGRVQFSGESQLTDATLRGSMARLLPTDSVVVMTTPDAANF